MSETNTKLPLHLVPDTAIAYESLAFLEGALTGGDGDWRNKAVKLSEKVGATRRHLAKFMAGEWADPESRVPHLASARANLGIILDAMCAGALVDDRPPALLELPGLMTSLRDTVKHLHELHAPKPATDSDAAAAAAAAWSAVVAAGVAPSFEGIRSRAVLKGWETRRRKARKAARAKKAKTLARRKAR